MGTGEEGKVGELGMDLVKMIGSFLHGVLRHEIYLSGLGLGDGLFAILFSMLELPVSRETAIAKRFFA